MDHTKHPPASLEDLVLAFRRKLLDVCRKEGFPHDLTMSQVDAVRTIGPNAGIAMKTLAERMSVAPPSASEIVAELEKKGVVERTHGKADRRAVTVTLTKKAKGIYKSMHKHKAAILSDMFSKLSAKDKKEFERIITILVSE